MFAVLALRAPAPLRLTLPNVLELIERARQRRALAELDERLLADIGLTKEAAALEARKPFWNI